MILFWLIADSPAIICLGRALSELFLSCFLNICPSNDCVDVFLIFLCIVSSVYDMCVFGVYLCFITSPSPRCPDGYFGQRCLQTEPKRLYMPKPNKSMLTWDAQQQTEDQLSLSYYCCLSFTSFRIPRLAGLSLSWNRHSGASVGSSASAVHNYAVVLMFSLLSFPPSSLSCFHPLLFLLHFFLSARHSLPLSLWFCLFPSGVQMTLLVIAVKPTLWPVSTVCPFLLLSVCLSVSLVCMLKLELWNVVL